MKTLIINLLVFALSMQLFAKEYHVSKTGDDNNPGTYEKPFLTIQAAANIAQPGDVITVHEEVYRERITPPRGGLSNEKRISYQAADGEKVEIKGSEVIKGWEKITGTVWKAMIPNSFFGNYNPYKDLIYGDWFNPLGRIHHTGEVYLNGKSLWEVVLIEDVINPKPKTERFDPEGSTYTWFCESNNEYTFIYANFHGADPNRELVEINVRESCFYPATTGINYITVRGFHMSQAATQWAAPTAEQIGLIGTFWSKGWIIENNVISDSKCSGITLGKDRKSGHNVWTHDPSKGGAQHYNEVIERVLADGWSKEKIGSHVVRNNTIFNCEQTGICGSLGAVFSIIEHNNIYNIWTKRQFAGAEMGGIKIHAPIDMLIKNNRLVNCGRGLWLDWMVQGTRVTGNLMYNNTTDDLFVEVTHGPFLVDNNFMLSPLSLRDWAQGGAYVHNLFAGNIEVRPQDRRTPFHKPHSTELAGLKETMCGDNRFYNNIFIGGTPETDIFLSGLAAYQKAKLKNYVNGNVYLNRATPFPGESNQMVLEDDPEIKISDYGSSLTISLKFGKNVLRMRNSLISSNMLGKAMVADQGFVHFDGTPLIIDTDFFGLPRNRKNPTVGPVENLKSETIVIQSNRWDRINKIL
jgi:hypothetical protein